MQETWVWFLSREDPLEKSESHAVMSDPGYPLHGILQARMLEGVAFPFSRGSPQPRDQTRVSLIASGFFTNWAIKEGPAPNPLKKEMTTHSSILAWKIPLTEEPGRL